MKFHKRLCSWLLAVILLATMLPIPASAKGSIMYGIGFTTGSDLRLRKEANTASKILDVSPKDEVVVVIGKTGDWYHVIYNLQEGYMHKNYVSVLKAQNAELGYGKVSGTDVNLRTGPGTNYKAVTQGNTGDKVYIIGLNNGWYKVIFDSRICYIRSDFVELTEIPYENDDSTNTPLFFRGGMSTGVVPNPDALKNPPVPEKGEDPQPTTPPATEPATEPTTAPTTPPEKDEPQDDKTDDGLMDGIAFTTGTDLLLRSEPSTKGKVLGVSGKNEVVVVIDKVGAWYKVNYNLKEGYMHGDYLKFIAKGNSELGYGRITGTGVNLRSGAGTNHKVVAVGNRGSSAYIIGIENGWYRVIYGQHICYIRSDYLSLTQAPYENPASPNVPKFFRGGVSTGVEPSPEALNGPGSTKPNPGTPGTNKFTGEDVVAFAKKYLGTPYRWGGTTPAGFDCSGFVYYVYNSMGYPLSRMITGMNSQGVYVSKADLQPGDIVIFQNTYASGLSHVGIYVGDGKFIHSPNSRSVVSIADLNSSYYTSHYYGARRIVTD